MLPNGYAGTKSMLKAKSAAQRAIEIDPTLAEAHASLAFFKLNYDWDWNAAEQEFRNALDLNPSYPRHTNGSEFTWQQESVSRMRSANLSAPGNLILCRRQETGT